MRSYLNIASVAASVAFFALAVTSARAAPIVLPVDGLDTADVNYTSYGVDLGGGISGISDATSLGAGGGSDHFDDAFGVTVGGTAYGVAGGDLTGSTLTLDTLSIGQFDVQVMLQSAGPIMRQIVSATNTGADGVASIRWHNNTGNDSSQTTIASSDGDLIGEASDRWIVTADNLTGDNNEVNSWILFGPGSPLVTPSSLAMVDGSAAFGGFGEQGLNAIFDVPIAAGGTASLMWFVGIEGINADGIALANEFNDTSSASFTSLISDLSDTQLSQIVNWDLGTSAEVPEPTSIALFGIGAIGLIGFHRRKLKRTA